MAAVKTTAKKTGTTVADLAVEKIKTLPELQEQFVAGLKTQIKDLQVQVRELPATLRTRFSEVADKVNETYAEASDTVTDTYGDLAERGEKVVTSIRRAPATQRAEARIKTAKTQTKAARTSVKKAVDSTEEAVEAAADTIG